MLRAYFDETGIHATSRTTLICGFIGTRTEWRRVTRKWQKRMKGKVFHYKEMRHETELLEKLAAVLGDSNLEAISMGFTGDWDRAINSGAADWPTRFPSCYQFVLEMCVQTIEKHSKVLWNSEPIGLTFSRQDEYAKFAEQIWRAYRDKGMWEYVVDFSYGNPDLLELQTADMLAYEVFQCTRDVYEYGKSSVSPETWEKWPLVKQLVDKRKLMLGSSMSEQTLVETLTEQDKHRTYVTVKKLETKKR